MITTMICQAMKGYRARSWMLTKCERQKNCIQVLVTFTWLLPRNHYYWPGDNDDDDDDDDDDGMS